MRFQNAFCILGLLVSACTTADYTTGIAKFSTAVSSANTAEQSLAAADQQARLAGWSQQVAKLPPTDTIYDVTKCRGADAPYKPGDCAITNSVYGAAPVMIEQSSLSAITKYAALLSAVSSDQSCASLQSNSKSLATIASDMAKLANDTGAAAAASPIATIVSTLGCVAIDQTRLSILRKATKAADPVVQSLAKVIAQKDAGMEANVLEEKIRILGNAETTYQASGKEADVDAVVVAASAVDAAHAMTVNSLVTQIATVHQTLTKDLQCPKVDLTRVEADAQALLSDAQAVQSAANSLIPAKSASGTSGGK